VFIATRDDQKHLDLPCHSSLSRERSSFRSIW